MQGYSRYSTRKIVTIFSFKIPGNSNSTLTLEISETEIAKKIPIEEKQTKRLELISLLIATHNESN